MKGLVIRTSGNTYLVKPVGLGDSPAVPCRAKGRFRLQGIRSTSPVAVGDMVDYSFQGDMGDAYITDIYPRRNYIVRKASNLSKQSHILAANVDQLALLCTVVRPETSTTFIDRVLAVAEAYEVPVILLFNKSDDLSPDERQVRDELMRIYANIGYDCLPLSVLKGNGMEQLGHRLQGKTTLLAGNSGTGKSTLLNAFVPDAKARVAAISDAYGTGCHTTTYSALYPLAGGGALIDTPGVKGFGTYDFKASQMSHYFRELFALAPQCRYGGGCTHTHEPGCAVLKALEEGQVAPSRYNSYLSMLSDEDEDRYRPPY